MASTSKGLFSALGAALVTATLTGCPSDPAADNPSPGDADAAPPTTEGKVCTGDADCNDLKCSPASKRCVVPSHDDGIKNLDETGTDCGGPTAKKCPAGEGCVADTDCDGTHCNAGTKTCEAPTSTDGLKNGTESDVDCGGTAPTNAPGCADGRACNADADCSSTFCSWQKKCVTARSCKGTVGSATAGIDTCGRRETTDPNKEHESCCVSLPLPTTTSVRLDKYEVTAGRFRQFVESIPGANIRKWVADEIAANTPTGQKLATDIPANLRDLLPASDTVGDPMNVVIQTGAIVMDVSEPSNLQGCFTDWGPPNSAGAYVTGAYGHATYWWPQATLQKHVGNSQYGGPNKGRLFTKEQYDEKSMNCAPYWLFAAFCAWDGGRLPTYEEMWEAYGDTPYPWGTATYTFPLDPPNYEDTANFRNGALFFYSYPDAGDARDLAGYIAAPGRFIKDKTSLTSKNGQSWMDLGANMMEVTRYNNGGIQTLGGESNQPNSGTFCDSSNLTGGMGTCTATGNIPGVIRATGMQTSIWVGGSWEGHARDNPEPYFSRSTFNLRVQTQYGKTGARCAR